LPNNPLTQNRSLDPEVRRTARILKEHYINKLGKPIKTPYYLAQLQVLYETDSFPWIVSDAIKLLTNEGFLTKIDASNMPKLGKLKYVKQIGFFVNSQAIKDQKDEKRIKNRAYRLAQIVDKYSSPTVSKMIGDHLESLVKAELRAQHFNIVGTNTNEYNGVKWTKTQHNLDFIAEYENSKFIIGVEVKNTLELIRPEEIDIKIEICKHLGIVPVFAVRFIKPYINCIKSQGGFSWVFRTQMYPLGREDFVRNIYQKLSKLNKTDSKGHLLQFPIIVRTELPPKSVKIFQEWISIVKDSPPAVNTTFKCTGPKPIKTSITDYDDLLDFQGKY